MKPFLKVAVAAAAGLMMTSVNASAAAGTEKSAIAPESVGSMSMDALQRRFVDLRFGMFIHFNMPTGLTRMPLLSFSIPGNLIAASGPRLPNQLE